MTAVRDNRPDVESLEGWGIAVIENNIKEEETSTDNSVEDSDEDMEIEVEERTLDEDLEIKPEESTQYEDMEIKTEESTLDEDMYTFWQDMEPDGPEKLILRPSKKEQTSYITSRHTLGIRWMKKLSHRDSSSSRPCGLSRSSKKETVTVLAMGKDGFGVSKDQFTKLDRQLQRRGVKLKLVTLNIL